MAQPSRTRRFLSAFIQPLTFVIGFPLAFASATHAPAPHDLSIVLVGPSAVVSEAAASLDSTEEFSVTHTDVAAKAQYAVFSREAVGSIQIQPVQDPRDPSAPPTFTVTTYIASGGGVAATEVVRQVGAELAAQNGTTAKVVDVAPLSDEDGTGSGLFFLLSYVSLGGYLVIISLLQFAPTARLRTRYLAAGVNAILAPLLVFSLSAMFVGGYGASFGIIVALLGTASLYVFTVSAIAILIAQYLGKMATVGVMVVIVFLGFPGSGGTIPASMMPPFWQGVHEVLFSSAALESFRSIVYFDGNGVGRWLPQLVAWTVIMVLLTGVVHLHRRVTAVSRREGAPTSWRAPRTSEISASGRPMNNPLVAIIGTAVMPLFFMILLTTSFVSAAHSPTPNNLPITIAGTAAVTEQVSVAIKAETDLGFAITTTTSPSSARIHVLEQESIGAILVNDTGVTIVKAAAAGATAAAAVTRVGSEVAAELGLPVTIQDAAPLAEDDVTGTALFLLLVACTVGGFLAIIGPSQVRSRLGIRMMLTTNAIAAVVIPVLAYSTLSIFVGDFGASFGILATVLGITMIYTFTVGLIATLFHQLVGVGSVFLVMILAVALNLPSTGGMSPASMLPSFWQRLHGFWFGSGGFEAMRSTLYFDGATTGQWLTQLLTWTGIILVLVIGTSILWARRGGTVKDLEPDRELESDSDDSVVANAGSGPSTVCWSDEDSSNCKVVGMGLREQNAERARNQIVQAALELFRTKGFEATTMDEIAERADIGSSTLYRYFSSKDAILLHRLAAPGAMANELRRRPPEEELSVALGHAVLAVLEIATHDEDVELEARAIIDQNPGPRSRLMDHFFQERHMLEQALADRLGRAIDDISVAMSARNAVLIMELAADRWRASDHAQSIVEVAEDVMRELSVSHINLPSAPSDAAADRLGALPRDVSNAG